MNALVETRNLTKYFTSGSFFQRKRTVVHAVDNVNINIGEGETLGLAGESGCGKTTLGRMLVQLIEPTSGEILLKGKDVSHLTKEEERDIRRETAIICQDPLGALNPRKTIFQSLTLPFKVHTDITSEEGYDKISNLLQIVGLSPPEFYIDRLPHEFSGGQRQRINVARAISLNPKFVVADEPVSALDLSVRAQILNLLKDLQRKFRMAYLFITHDLSVLRSVSHRVAIMYLGEIVEYAKVYELYKNPLHPYTKAILSATPVPDPEKKRKRILLSGDVPSPIDPPSGCRFHTRCWAKKNACAKEKPELVEVRNNHYVACCRC